MGAMRSSSPPKSAGSIDNAEVIVDLPNGEASSVEGSFKGPKKRPWQEISSPHSDDRRKRKSNGRFTTRTDNTFSDNTAQVDTPTPSIPKFTAPSIDKVLAEGSQLNTPGFASIGHSSRDKDDSNFQGEDDADKERQALILSKSPVRWPSEMEPSISASWAGHDDRIPSIEYDKEVVAPIIPLPIPPGTKVITRDMFKDSYEHTKKHDGDDHAAEQAMLEKSRVDMIDNIPLYEDIWMTYLNIGPRIRAHSVHHKTALHVSYRDHQWRLRYDPDYFKRLAYVPLDTSEDTKEREQVLIHKVHSLVEKVIGSSGSLEDPLEGNDWDKIIKSVSDACAGVNSKLLPILAKLAGCPIVMWPRAFDFLVLMSCASVWRNEGDQELEALQIHVDEYHRCFPKLENLSSVKQKAVAETEAPEDHQSGMEILDTISLSEEHLDDCRRIQEAFELAIKDLTPDGNRASSPPTTNESHFRYDGRVIRTHTVDPKGELLSVSLKFHGKVLGPTYKIKPGPYRLCWGGARMKSSHALGVVEREPLVVAKARPSSKRAESIENAYDAGSQDDTSGDGSEPLVVNKTRRASSQAKQYESTDDEDSEDNNSANGSTGHGRSLHDKDWSNSEANGPSGRSATNDDDEYDSYGDPKSD